MITWVFRNPKREADFEKSKRFEGRESREFVRGRDTWVRRAEFIRNHGTVVRFAEPKVQGE